MLDPSVETLADVRAIAAIFRWVAMLSVAEAALSEEDGDGVVAQFGTSDARSQRGLAAVLTRQFVEVGDKHAPLWMLSCTFYASGIRLTTERHEPDKSTGLRPDLGDGG